VSRAAAGLRVAALGAALAAFLAVVLLSGGLSADRDTPQARAARPA
jgi:hypothetical protein